MPRKSLRHALSAKAFSSLRLSERPSKPRLEGITEIRDDGLSTRQVEDLLEVGSDYIDILKMSAGTQRLLPRNVVRDKIKLCHDNKVLVSTGGLLERVLLEGPEAVQDFLEEAKNLGFDIVEVSTGVVAMSVSDKIRLMKKVMSYGFKPKPEVAQTYGITTQEEVPINVEKLIAETKVLLDNGASMIMIESEGLTENVKEWKTDVIHKIAASFDLRNLMFEAADEEVFEWYIRNFGPNVNLYVDHSQVLHLEYLREGLWGKRFSWGRVVSYRKGADRSG